MLEDDEDNNLSSLFICEDYVEREWIFGNHRQQLLCSPMSSTDHDLTGQIVWPASILLGLFIYSHRELFSNKVVIELGAGCGLGGFVAANFSSFVSVTDGNDVVIRLLERNNVHLNYNNVHVEKVMWGSYEEVDKIIHHSGSHADIIIGADIILWPNQVISLLYTIGWILMRKPNSAVCYISYIVRAKSTTVLFYETAVRLGLSIEEIPIASFLYTSQEESTTVIDMLNKDSSGEKHLFRIIIDPVRYQTMLSSSTNSNSSTLLFDPNAEEIITYQNNMNSTSLPCNDDNNQSSSIQKCISTLISGVDSKFNDIDYKFIVIGYGAAFSLAIFAGSGNAVKILEYIDKKKFKEI
eukprot:gene5698-7865_t